MGYGKEMQESLAPSTDELDIFDDITRLSQMLWESSQRVVGLSTDPKMFSIMLYKRLWSNHRGFVQLWRNSLPLEADIVLRSGIEAAICIAANFRLRERFVMLMRQDAAFTITGQIKLHRTHDEQESVRDGEAALRDLLAGLPMGAKAAKLEWQALAREGQVPQLYDWHRMLSGISSHVTGLSVLNGVTDDTPRTSGLQGELRNLTQKMRPMMMAGATLNGSMHHAGMLDEQRLLEAVLQLTDRLNEISKQWPGAEA